MSNFNRLGYGAKRGQKINLKLPERWKEYTTIGKVVAGTRFLPFKTPLKEEICRRSLPKKDWFTPAMLLKKAPNLKLIIDLTQTDRFYAGEYFNTHGVHHHKITCPGGGKSLPSRQIIQKFTQTIDDFLASEDGLDQDSLIGVHCTHGLNRTGYLICKYIIERQGTSGEAAVKAFEEARGHKIERHLYTNDILDLPLVQSPPSKIEVNRSSNLERIRYSPYTGRREGWDNTNWRDHPDPNSYWEDRGYNYASSDYRQRISDSRHYRKSRLNPDSSPYDTFRRGR